MRHPSVPRFLPPLAAGVVLVAALVYLTSVSGQKNGPLRASGTVETVERVVASELAGRVAEVLVQEGDAVESGQVVLHLDPELLEAQRERALQAVAAAQASVQSADANLRVVEIQLEMAQAAGSLQQRTRVAAEWSTDQPADFALPGWYFLPDETWQAAEAESASALEAWDRASAHLEDLQSRPDYADLVAGETRLGEARQGYLAADDAYDQAVNAFRGTDLLEAALDRRDLAEQELEDAQEYYDTLVDEVDVGPLRQARAEASAAQALWLASVDRLNRLRTGDQSFDWRLALVRLDRSRAAKSQAEAGLRLAEADLATLDLQIARLTLEAPAAGIVMARSVEPGEILQPGAPALTIGLLDSLTITVYLPEDRYGEASLGDEAVVTVDSFPGVEFRAVVTRIAEEAEYTPRNVQTDEGRRTTVFAVELSVRDDLGKLKPGMPADVLFAES
jgi:HlyD family secretion protein